MFFVRFFQFFFILFLFMISLCTLSLSVFIALSTVFHSTSSPDNFPLCSPDVDFDAHPKQMQLGTLRAGVTSAIFSETEIQSRTKWGMRGVA